MLPIDEDADNSTYNIYDDLDLIFIVYFGVDYRPSAEEYDFNCTLPITYYDINGNVTVTIGK